MLVSHSWAWGLPWDVANMPSDTPLEKSDFSFPSVDLHHPMQICLGDLGFEDLEQWSRLQLNAADNFTSVSVALIHGCNKESVIQERLLEFRKT